MCGPEKVGKTVTALTRKCSSIMNVKSIMQTLRATQKRDLEGISDLSLDPEKMKIIAQRKAMFLLKSISGLLIISSILSRSLLLTHSQHYQAESELQAT